MIKIVSFKLNKLPKPNLKDGFLIASGIAPSSIPWGHIYLQNMGGITSYLFSSMRVIASTSPRRITYLIYRKTLSFFVLNFGGNLCQEVLEESKRTKKSTYKPCKYHSKKHHSSYNIIGKLIFFGTHYSLHRSYGARSSCCRARVTIKTWHTSSFSRPCVYSASKEVLDMDISHKACKGLNDSAV